MAVLRRIRNRRRRVKRAVGKRVARRGGAMTRYGRPLGGYRVSRYNYPFPEKKYSKLTYCDELVITPGGVGLGAYHIFRAASIFDPDYTGTGHQPRYHDILQSVYERYCVVGSKITVRFWAPGSSSAGQCMVYVTLRPNSGDQPTTAASYSNIMEQGGVTFRPLGARDGGTDCTKIVRTYSPRRLYSKNPKDEDDLQALYGASPSTSPVFILGVVPVNSADTIGAVRVTVKMDFAVLSMRKKHDLTED